MPIRFLDEEPKRSKIRFLDEEPASQPAPQSESDYVAELRAEGATDQDIQTALRFRRLKGGQRRSDAPVAQPTTPQSDRVDFPRVGRNIQEFSRTPLQSKPLPLVGQVPLPLQVGARAGRVAASGVADALSAPGRIAASLPRLAPGGETFTGSLSDTEGKNFLGKIVRDPATLPSLAVGGGAVKALRGAPLATKVGAGALAGLGEGALSAGIHGAERFGETGQGPKAEDAAEIALSTAVGGALPIAGAARQAVGGKINKLVGRFSQELTGVDEEALRLMGTKQGREALQGAFNTQAEIGQELADMINNAFDYMPDGKQIRAAIEGAPSVNVVPLINKLESLAGNPRTKEMQVAADLIRGKAEELRLMASQGDTGFVRPIDLLDYRQEIDNAIGDQFGKDSGKYISALKQIRHDIRQGLLNTAKGTEYESSMKDLAKKLDALDKVKRMMGGDQVSREMRAESFIRNINSKGKAVRRQWLQDFSELFGGDFVEKSKLARFAEMAGPEGKGGLMPNWPTGKSLLGPLYGPAGLAVGSPRIAAMTTLPATTAIASESLPGVGQSLFRLGARGQVRNVLDEER